MIYRHKVQVIALVTCITFVLLYINFINVDRHEPVVLQFEQIQRRKNIPPSEKRIHINKEIFELNKQNGEVNLLNEIARKKLKLANNVEFREPKLNEMQNLIHFDADQSYNENNSNKKQPVNDIDNQQMNDNNVQSKINYPQFGNKIYPSNNNVNNVNNFQNNDNFNNFNHYGMGFQNGQDAMDDKKYELIETELSKLERVIHVDLKGAVPKVEYFKEFFKMIKDFGATGVLLEYEDVFPYKGRLSEAVHGEVYSMKDVEFIKKQAADNNLYIIPLVQTYGHLEWILKVKSFAHLRDHQDYPQVMTQCLDESYDVIFDMLDQVIAAHNDVKYFHVGLDEVYYKLLHPNCSETSFHGDFTKAFLSHLTKVAEHVRKRLPKAKILIWDDMLHNMDESVMEEFKPQIEKYEIEPMIWAYMEDVKNWFQPYLYIKYGHIFQNVWASSAYKGASGELTTVTSIKHHYLNHLSWIDVILEKQRLGVVNFRGVVITGWSRYDHFLQLCDILPEAIPSLIMNLQTLQYGRITTDRKYEIGKRLGCSADIPWTPEDIYFGSIKCTFPGHEIYEAILPINTIISRAKEDMDFSRKYMTPIHLNYNYLHKQRAHEVLEKLRSSYYNFIQFINHFKFAARTLYTNDTINEWLAVYVSTELDPIYDMILDIQKHIDTKDWKPRPQKIKLREYPENI